MKKFTIKIYIVFGLLSCTTTQPSQQFPEATDKKIVAPTVVAPQVKNCGQERSMTLPFQVSGLEKPLFVTNLQSKCNNDQLVSRVSYLTLPCTQGRHDIKVFGHRYSPKWLEFSFSSVCASFPLDEKVATQKAESVMQLKSQKIDHVFFPMMVQYWRWDLPQAGEGIGDQITWATDEYNQIKQWQLFTKNEHKLKVFLYGREQSWSSRGGLYRVYGEITYSEPVKFSFTPIEAKLVDEKERNELRDSCQAPGCQQLF